MPKVSKETATGGQGVEGMVDDRSEELDGFLVGFTSFACDIDGTPLMKGLPGDQCQCPHWGYVFSGRMWFKNGDDVESVEAGNAFYIPAGHTSGADAGSEFLIVSPEELISELEQHMMKRAQELQAQRA